MLTPEELHTFEQNIRQSWPEQDWRDLTVLLAVSGGSDSLAMLRAFHRLSLRQQDYRGRIEVAHFNHRWRPVDSAKDEAFVVSICDELGLVCHVGRSSLVVEKEQAAREERYGFLRSTAERRGARYVATAHTLEDQAETILHRLIRGTGLRGLGGMRARRRISDAVTLARPLLWATRKCVLEYLAALQQAHRDDSTNKDCRFTRNRIRHELLPLLAAQYNPMVLQSLLRLGNLAREADQQIQEQIATKLATVVQQSTSHLVVLDRIELLKLSDFMICELFATLWRKQGWPQQAMGFEQWQRLVESTRRQRTIYLPGEIRVETTPDTLRLKSSDVDDGDKGTGHQQRKKST